MMMVASCAKSTKQRVPPPLGRLDVEVPELAKRAPNPGLVARDQIARMTQAALECRQGQHALKLCTFSQMSNSVEVKARSSERRS